MGFGPNNSWNLVLNDSIKFWQMSTLASMDHIMSHITQRPQTANNKNRTLVTHLSSEQRMIINTTISSSFFRSWTLPIYKQLLALHLCPIFPHFNSRFYIWAFSSLSMVLLPCGCGSRGTIDVINTCSKWGNCLIRMCRTSYIKGNERWILALFLLHLQQRRQEDWVSDKRITYVPCQIEISPLTFVYTGCPKKKDTVTLSHNFRLNYLNSKFQAGM